MKQIQAISFFLLVSVFTPLCLASDELESGISACGEAHGASIAFRHGKFPIPLGKTVSISMSRDTDLVIDVRVSRHKFGLDQSQALDSLSRLKSVGALTFGTKSGVKAGARSYHFTSSKMIQVNAYAKDYVVTVTIQAGLRSTTALNQVSMSNTAEGLARIALASALGSDLTPISSASYRNTNGVARMRDSRGGVYIPFTTWAVARSFQSYLNANTLVAQFSFGDQNWKLPFGTNQVLRNSVGIAVNAYIVRKNGQFWVPIQPIDAAIP